MTTSCDTMVTDFLYKYTSLLVKAVVFTITEKSPSNACHHGRDTPPPSSQHQSRLCGRLSHRLPCWRFPHGQDWSSLCHCLGTHSVCHVLCSNHRRRSRMRLMRPARYQERIAQEMAGLSADRHVCNSNVAIECTSI